MRIIGLDIHRAFAEAVAWDDGKLKRLGRVDMRRHLLEAFAKKLIKEDVVVVEATGNAASVAAVIAPHVKKVVIANPKQVRIIAHAKIKTDTIDASVLAQLYASGFLPEVWIPDEPTQALRRQVTRRNQIVRQRSRLKNIIQSILHSHLIPSCPHADLCGASGRAWLFHQVLPEDERLAVERHLREFDRLGEDLKVIERDIQDFNANATRFLVLGRQGGPATGHDRTSVMFSIADKVGALHQALASFRRYKLNMTKIESRPSKRKAWEYFFFIDCAGHFQDAKVAKAIEHLGKHCNFVKILGSYPNAE